MAVDSIRQLIDLTTVLINKIGLFVSRLYQGTVDLTAIITRQLVELITVLTRQFGDLITVFTRQLVDLTEVLTRQLVDSMTVLTRQLVKLSAGLQQQHQLGLSAGPPYQTRQQLPAVAVAPKERDAIMRLTAAEHRYGICGRRCDLSIAAEQR